MSGKQFHGSAQHPLAPHPGNTPVNASLNLPTNAVADQTEISFNLKTTRVPAPKINKRELDMLLL